VYVLQNLRKHGIHLHGPDPLSSGPDFDGWRPESVPGASPSARGGSRPGGSHAVDSPHGGGTVWCAPVSLLRAGRVETPSPKTWLLNVGWRRHGLIDPGECPMVR
jgi:hypothetical protein